MLCAGIGGGFAPLPVGAIAVASEIVFADLGAQTPDGFASASALGFGADRYAVAPRLAVELADCTGGHLGTVLTVATVTGTAARRGRARRPVPRRGGRGHGGRRAWPRPRRSYGVPVAEVRAISNAVGPRDRDVVAHPGGPRRPRVGGRLGGCARMSGVRLAYSTLPERHLRLPRLGARADRGRARRSR